MSTEMARTIFVLVTTGLFAAGLLIGRDQVHDEWRKDAIERCEKVQTKEWCEGRAVLEKW